MRIIAALVGALRLVLIIFGILPNVIFSKPELFSSINYTLTIIGTLMLGFSTEKCIEAGRNTTSAREADQILAQSENQIARLLTLKTLLDNGMITQSEFDKKRGK